MEKNEVDLSSYEKEKSAAYFKDCETKNDVRKVLRRQVELEIPTGLSRNARKIANYVKKEVIEHQLDFASFDGKPEGGWKNVMNNYLPTIGGCRAFYHPKDFAPGEGYEIDSRPHWKDESVSMYLVYDGGMLHDWYSSYHYSTSRSELEEMVSKMNDGTYLEDYANWSLCVAED